MAAMAGMGAGTGVNVLRVLMGAAAGLGAAYVTLRLVRMKETDYIDGLARRAFGRLTGRSAD
jgi:hypothetical protein